MSGAAAVGVEARGAAAVVEELPVIRMVEPMPGFPDRSLFTLVRIDDESALFALQSVEDPDLRFLVVPAGIFFPDYQPEVDVAVVEELAMETPEEIVTLLVVNPGDSAAGATVNLLAPVLVNHVTRLAAQVVLTEDLPVRAPLLAS